MIPLEACGDARQAKMMRDASGTWQAAQLGTHMRQFEAGVYESLKMKVALKF